MKRKAGIAGIAGALCVGIAGIALTNKMKNEEIQKRQKAKDKFKGY